MNDLLLFESLAFESKSFCVADEGKQIVVELDILSLREEIAPESQLFTHSESGIRYSVLDFYSRYKPHIIQWIKARCQVKLTNSQLKLELVDFKAVLKIQLA